MNIFNQIKGGISMYIVLAVALLILKTAMDIEDGTIEIKRG